jgi:hypothetical protein
MGIAVFGAAKVQLSPQSSRSRHHIVTDIELSGHCASGTAVESGSAKNSAKPGAQEVCEVATGSDGPRRRKSSTSSTSLASLLTYSRTFQALPATRNNDNQMLATWPTKGRHLR